MRLIELPHKVCGMTCMINGQEDLYEHRTGTRLPDWLLFYVSGMPPAPPNRLTGYETPDKHAGGVNGLADLQQDFAHHCWHGWAEAAAVLKQSGQALMDLTDATVDYLLGESGTLQPAVESVTQVADLEEQAYRLLLNGSG